MLRFRGQIQAQGIYVLVPPRSSPAILDRGLDGDYEQQLQQGKAREQL